MPADASSTVLVNRVGILGAGGCGYLTVTDAIANASNGDTILVEAGQTFYERLGTINVDVTIRAGTAGCTGVAGAGSFATIDAGHAGRLAEVAADVTFRQMSLLNGTAGNGVSVGAAFNAGGNLWISSGTTTLIDTTVFGGTLAVPLVDLAPYGAGIHVAAGAGLEVRGASKITGNINPGIGPGGVMVEAGATANFEDTTRIGLPVFGANLANQGPGGLLVKGTAELRDDVQVAGNDSDLAGGGIYIWQGEVWLLDNARIANNSARDGGGIAVVNGTLHTTGNVEIEDNDADDEGGGIWIASGMLDIQGATRIAGNEAVDCGGGIFADGDPASTTVYLTGTTVDGNDSDACGGGVAVLGGLFEADGATVISNNDADTDGGGVYLTGVDSEADLRDVTIATNTANRGAGLAMLSGATVYAQELTIDENTATTDGGGALVEGSATA